MTKTAIVISAALVLCGGCFDNKERPASTPTAKSVSEAESMRAEVQRVLLRGKKDSDISKLASFPEIRELDISCLNLEEVPSAVSTLAKLKNLWIVRNNIKALPDSLFTDKLEYLNATGNKISEIPQSISNAKSLRWLHADSNSITALPDSFARLEKLQVFHASHNKFLEVPPQLKNCKELSTINLEGNRKISSVPQWMIDDLPKLEFVNLSGTSIRKLPADLSGWKKLKALTITDCPLELDMEETQRLRNALGDSVSILF